MTTVTKKLELFLELKDKIAADAKRSAAGLRDVGSAAEKAQDKLDDLSSRYSLGARNAELLRKRLDELKNSTKASTDQIERAQLRYDAASAALQRIERQAHRTSDAFKTVKAPEQLAPTVTKATSSIDGLTNKVTGLATGFITLEAATTLWNASVEAWTIAASIEANRGAVNRLMQDVTKGNAAWSDASKFARKYGFTQQEISGALAQAAPILKKYNSDTEKTLSVLARLGSLNPKEGIEGATMALRELASGDIQSMVERFNLGRKEVQALNAEIKAGADPVAVLDAYLTNMGVTSEALADRMTGLNGATNTLRQGTEDLQLSFIKILEAVGVPEFLTAVGHGMQEVAKHMTTVAQFMPQFAEAIGPAMQAAFGPMLQIIQFMKEFPVAFEAGKAGAANFATGLQGINGSADELGSTIPDVVSGIFSIQEAADQAAGMSDHHARAVQGLRDDLESGVIGINEFEDAIYDMLPAQEASIDGTLDGTYALNEQTAAIDEATAAIINKYFEDENAAQSANENAQQQAVLGSVLEGLADQSMGPERAMYLLRDAFNITGDQASVLYRQLQALAMAMAPFQKLMGFSLDIGAAIGNAGSTEIANLAKAKIYSPRSSKIKKSRSGGSGRKGGKSDEEKAAEKAARAQEKATEREQKELEKRQENQEKYRKTLEERTLQHYARLAKINQDYYKQAAENERKFNGEKFTEQANFWNSVADMEGGQRARLLAEERRLWDESQKIAQTGRAAEAQAYYEAGLEIIEAQAARDAKIAELRQAANDAATEEERKAIEEEIALRQRADDQLTDQENQRLDRMKDAEDSVKKERDEALSEEQADYQEANQKLRDQFVETNEALVAYADQQMQLFAGLAQAAAQAQQAVHTFTPGSTAAPEPRAFGGGMYRNQPYLTGERGPELIVPQRNSTAIPADRTRAILAAERSIMQPPTTAVGPATGNTSSTSTTINMPITFATGTPTREIQSARQELAALIDERISKANRATGIGALRRNRS